MSRKCESQANRCTRNEKPILGQFITVGNSGVGKSSLLRREATGAFTTNFVCTLSIDFHVRMYSMDDQITVKARLWDTFGEERFSTLSPRYYKRANGVFICYDVTDENSFDQASVWYQSALHHIPQGCLVCLVACKIDLEERRVVSEDRGKELASLYHIPYYETSAKTSEGVNECFEHFVKYWYENRFNLEKDSKLLFESRRLFIDTLGFTDPMIDIIWSMLFTPEQIQTIRIHAAVDDVAQLPESGNSGICQIS